MRARPAPFVALTLACFALASFATPLAGADVNPSLTVRETISGAPTTTVAGCSFFVRGTDLAIQSGTLRVFLPQGNNPPIELAAVPFVGVPNTVGLFDILVGPIVLDASYTDLFAVTDFVDNDPLELFTPDFDVQCAVTCDVTSFLPPIGTPGHARGGIGQSFKFGQTIPVKLDATCSGPAPTPAIFVAKATGAGFEVERPGTSKAAAFADNEMRRNGNHWHFNLDTASMSKGLWKVRVELGDGIEHAVLVDLR